MKLQWNRIAEVRMLLWEDNGIELALVVGELAGERPSVNAIAQFCCGVNQFFDANGMLSRLENYFSERLLKAFHDRRKEKIILCFRYLPTIEIYFGSTLDTDFKTIFPAALFPDKSGLFLLFDRPSNVKNFTLKAPSQKIQNTARELSIPIWNDDFLIEFEACSWSHRRGNGHLFYNTYKMALQEASKLLDLSQDQPTTTLSVESFITEGEACLDLSQANRQKRVLLDLYYSSVRKLVSTSRLAELMLFCEAVYTRDFLWNFRDVSQFNHRIKPGLIYRTATLSLIQGESFFANLLAEKNIKTVIDLRSEDEVRGKNYSDKSLEHFTRAHVPIDHLTFSSEFRQTQSTYASLEDIYRFFVLDCIDSVKTALEVILKADNPIAIHCHSGKDRTGFLVTLLHLLSGANLETVYDDYLASERDTKKEHLDIILDHISKKGGIENYLLYCGLNYKQITTLKQKLMSEELK
jgi:protein tyrosine/serine phosphatase